MPLYEYRCEEDGSLVTLLRSMAEADEPVEDPEGLDHLLNLEIDLADLDGVAWELKVRGAAHWYVEEGRLRAESLHERAHLQVQRRRRVGGGEVRPTLVPSMVPSMVRSVDL